MRVSMASWTHSALFPVSETCSISTVVNVVAAKYSGARLIRILRSRYFFSLFRLSGAATRPVSHEACVAWTELDWTRMGLLCPG